MKVTSSPHIRSKNSTSGIMFLVILALLPTSIFGVWNFGIKALLVICITVSTTVLTELLYQIFMKQKTTISDLSAVVTGLLLALNLPSTIPWWVCVIGGVFAILVIKMLFGGIGQNFMNPALGARAFLIISFTPLMTNFEYDGVSSATPLAMLKAGSDVNVMDMVMGSIPGTIGETSMIAIVLGACLLILTGVIDLRIPGTYIVSFAIFLGLFGENGFNFTYISAHLAGGGLMLGAFFMATDYVTRPLTKKGQYLYGLFLGILTGIFRVYGPSAEGVSYAIIIGNLIVPLIEKITLPKPFGKGGEKI